MLKVILIDDERLARNELRRMLGEFSDVEIIGEAANASEGIEKIDSLNPPSTVNAFSEAFGVLAKNLVEWTVTVVE